VTFLGGQHHLVEQRLHDKLGHVVRVGPNSLSFSSLSDFEAIYGFNKCFEKGDFYNFSRENRRTENIFSSRTEASHREHRRKVVSPALSVGKVASYKPVISKNVSVLILRLKALLKESQGIDIAALLHRYTFDAVVEIIYGEPVCPQPYTDNRASAGTLTAFREMSKWSWAGGLLPWLGSMMETDLMQLITRRSTYDSEGRQTGIQALAGRTRTLVFAQPEEAIKSAQPSIVKSFLSVAQDSPNHMSADEIWRESFNLIFAGPGSTAAALTALFFHLGTTEGRIWQAHIRAEQKGSYMESDGKERASQYPSSAMPPVLLAVIKETLRLDTPFPSAFPRVIMPGAESAIPNLPAPLPVGTVVSAHTFILGRSKFLWGSDAEVWRPDRWLGQANNAGLDENFVPFGKGSRGCIGKEIAMFMIARAVTAVLEEWDITAVAAPKAKGWLEMQYQECVISFAPLGGI
jgi:benzoate 4-monooxygenase